MRRGLLRRAFAAIGWLSGACLYWLTKIAMKLGDEHEMLHCANAIMVGDSSDCVDGECWLHTKRVKLWFPGADEPDQF